VRAVYLNGSRTNPNASHDRFQDYDVVYAVTDTKPYRENPNWINHFGTVLYMQMPEAMDELLGKECNLEETFGWLAIFTDGNRVDIHVSSMHQLPLLLRLKADS
jgi:aminoglycoside 6-adenylyltransferase